MSKIEPCPHTSHLPSSFNVRSMTSYTRAPPKHWNLGRRLGGCRIIGLSTRCGKRRTVRLERELPKGLRHGPKLSINQSMDSTRVTCHLSYALANLQCHLGRGGQFSVGLKFPIWHMSVPQRGSHAAHQLLQKGASARRHLPKAPSLLHLKNHNSLNSMNFLNFLNRRHLEAQSGRR